MKAVKWEHVQCTCCAEGPAGSDPRPPSMIHRRQSYFQISFGRIFSAEIRVNLRSASFNDSVKWSWKCMRCGSPAAVTFLSNWTIYSRCALCRIVCYKWFCWRFFRSRSQSHSPRRLRLLAFLFRKCSHSLSADISPGFQNILHELRIQNVCNLSNILHIK